MKKTKVQQLLFVSFLCIDYIFGFDKQFCIFSHHNIRTYYFYESGISVVHWTGWSPSCVTLHYNMGAHGRRSDSNCAKCFSEKISPLLV